MSTYENDFYGWVFDQAEFLRAGRFVDLDVEHLIEEIESMGRREKRTLESRLIVLLHHLLKWQYQPARRGRSWQSTIKVQRRRLAEVVDDNPSLKPKIPELLASAYIAAISSASAETGIDETVFPQDCPWSFAQIMETSFYPE